jgi:hypothetical protein
MSVQCLAGSKLDNAGVIIILLTLADEKKNLLTFADSC